jgi:ketosteroid isomerase-like protein
LVGEANKPAAEGLALIAHAVSIGDYFTTDTVVDLGAGSTPIPGREMLIGMVARLQPRTAAYRVELDDVEVRVSEDGESAGVAATVIITSRRPGPDDGADAREFALTLTKADGDWRIARMTAVQTLR